MSARQQRQARTEDATLTPHTTRTPHTTHHTLPHTPHTPHTTRTPHTTHHTPHITHHTPHTTHHTPHSTRTPHTTHHTPHITHHTSHTTHYTPHLPADHFGIVTWLESRESPAGTTRHWHNTPLAQHTAGTTRHWHSTPLAHQLRFRFPAAPALPRSPAPSPQDMWQALISLPNLAGACRGGAVLLERRGAGLLCAVRRCIHHAPC